MSALTGALYGALIVYLGGWFVGYWTGNFSLLLFLLTVVTVAVISDINPNANRRNQNNSRETLGSDSLTCGRRLPPCLKVI